MLPLLHDYCRRHDTAPMITERLMSLRAPLCYAPLRAAAMRAIRHMPDTLLPPPLFAADDASLLRYFAIIQMSLRLAARLLHTKMPRAACYA